MASDVRCPCEEVWALTKASSHPTSLSATVGDVLLLLLEVLPDSLVDKDEKDLVIKVQMSLPLTPAVHRPSTNHDNSH